MVLGTQKAAMAQPIMRVVGLIVVVLTAKQAQAFDVLPPSTAPNKTQHVVVDSSFDTNSLRSSSWDVNGTFAPFGDVYESGFRFRLTGSASWYRFIAGEDARTFASGRSLEGDLLFGYLLALPRVSVLGLLGGAGTEGNDNGTITRRTGGKAVVSMFAQPTDSTMAYANYSFSSINNYYQLQNKVGVKLFGLFYFGPEATFSGMNRDDVQKYGAHVSALNVGPVTVSFSGGVIHDRQLGNGQYFGLNLYGTL
jgi:hypothetical protein